MAGEGSFGPWRVSGINELPFLHQTLPGDPRKEFHYPTMLTMVRMGHVGLRYRIPRFPVTALLHVPQVCLRSLIACIGVVQDSIRDPNSCRSTQGEIRKEIRKLTVHRLPRWTVISSLLLHQFPGNLAVNSEIHSVRTLHHTPSSSPQLIEVTILPYTACPNPDFTPCNTVFSAKTVC